MARQTATIVDITRARSTFRCRQYDTGTGAGAFHQVVAKNFQEFYAG